MHYVPVIACRRLVCTLHLCCSDGVQPCTPGESYPGLFEVPGEPGRPACTARDTAKDTAACGTQPGRKAAGLSARAWASMSRKASDVSMDLHCGPVVTSPAQACWRAAPGLLPLAVWWLQALGHEYHMNYGE